MAANKINPIQAIKEAAREGLKNLVPDVTVEAERLMKQGSNEIVAALFGGNAFVQYGSGQYTAERDSANDMPHEPQHENEGMER